MFSKIRSVCRIRFDSLFSFFVSENEIAEFYIAGADAIACVKSTCYNMTKEINNMSHSVKTNNSYVLTVIGLIAMMLLTLTK